MIRKCGNCYFFHKEFNSCSSTKVTNAYDHTKKIFLMVGENLYCEKHEFNNEEQLRDEAIVVEFENIVDAMEVIKKSKTNKDLRKSTFGNDDY